jgi:hypothetical protein
VDEPLGKRVDAVSVTVDAGTAELERRLVPLVEV